MGVDFGGVGIGPRLRAGAGRSGFVNVVRRIRLWKLTRPNLVDDSIDRGLHDGGVDRLTGLDQRVAAQRRSERRLVCSLRWPDPGRSALSMAAWSRPLRTPAVPPRTRRRPDVAASQHGDFLRFHRQQNVRVFR